MIGGIAVATSGVLAAFWKLTEGEVLVNTRLLLAVVVTTVLGLGALWWCSLRRYQRLRIYENAKLKLASEEEDILRLFVAHDTTALSPHWVEDQMKFTRFRFHLHWHQLFGVHHFLDHVKDEDGEEAYMLSHMGRKYIGDNGLDR